ncbi:hypothetical protein SMICM304S_11916 [Streptomyces microflavus]
MPTVAPAPGRQSTLLTLSAGAVVKPALVLPAVPPALRVAAATVYAVPGTALRPEERAYGLLRWKLGTGGQVVETLGEWERPLGGSANHALHHAFQAYLKRR